MIFANLKNGCKRACNLVKNSRAVRFCVLVAVCLTFNVATALAQSGGGAGYEAGKNAISQASEQIAQYVPIATKLCYAIAGVVAIVGAISVYVKMNNEEQDVKNILVLQNWLERIRKEVTNKVLSIKRISDFLNFPILAQPTLKKI